MSETPVAMPQLGNEIEEAQIDEWQKNVGDVVEAKEHLVTITTPKVTMEIEAPVGGVVKEILVEVDDIAAVGTVLAIIESN